MWLNIYIYVYRGDNGHHPGKNDVFMAKRLSLIQWLRVKRRIKYPFRRNEQMREKKIRSTQHTESKNYSQNIHFPMKCHFRWCLFSPVNPPFRFYRLEDFTFTFHICWSYFLHIFICPWNVSIFFWIGRSHTSSAFLSFYSIYFSAFFFHRIFVCIC